MPVVTLMIGLPGSGKSTYADTNFSNKISQDEFLGNKKPFLEALHKLFVSGVDFTVDRCHITVAARKEIIDIAKTYSYEAKAVEIKTRKGVCIQRALNRKEHKTLSKTADVLGIVNRFYNDYQKPYLEEGFSNIETIIDETPDFQTLDLTNLNRPILVIGDVHGCFEELEKLVELAKTELGEQGKDLFVLSVGDIVDKGPENLKCLQFFMDLKLAGNGDVVQGNHENRFRRYLIGNPVKITYGLDKTVEELETSNIDRQSLIDFLGALPSLAFLPGDTVAVHGGVDPRKPLRNQTEEVLLYARYMGGKTFLDPSGIPWFHMKAHESWSNKTIMFGHWVGDDTYGTYQTAIWSDTLGGRPLTDIKPNKKTLTSEIPARGGRHDPESVSFISLDTGCVAGGVLTGVIVMPDNDRAESYLKLIQVAPKKKHNREEDVKSQTKKTGHELLDKLFEIARDGFLSYSESKTPAGLNLVLFNYTEKCTFAREWNEYTLAARGTIYDKDTGLVHAKSFPKFFNLGENSWTMPDDLPFDKPFRVFEKMDGSLGLIHKTGNGEFAISTRGSFYSEQSKEATKMLGMYHLGQLNLDNVSLLVEIIYPENRIQVNYGARRELVLLGGYDNDSGRELDWEDVEAYSQWTGIPICPTVQVTDLDTLMKMKSEGLWDKEEGWVVLLANGIRVKIKCDDYIRIAKVKAHLGPLAIWDSMAAGRIENYIQGIPEELRPDAESILKKLSDDQQSMLDYCASVALKLNVANVSDKADRKDVALRIQSSGQPEWIKSCMFSIMSGKTPDAVILKYLRPDSNKYVDLDDLFQTNNS